MGPSRQVLGHPVGASAGGVGRGAEPVVAVLGGALGLLGRPGPLQHDGIEAPEQIDRAPGPRGRVGLRRERGAVGVHVLGAQRHRHDGASAREQVEGGLGQVGRVVLQEAVDVVEPHHDAGGEQVRGRGEPPGQSVERGARRRSHQAAVGHVRGQGVEQRAGLPGRGVAHHQDDTAGGLGRDHRLLDLTVAVAAYVGGEAGAVGSGRGGMDAQQPGIGPGHADGRGDRGFGLLVAVPGRGRWRSDEDVAGHPCLDQGLRDGVGRTVPHVRRAAGGVPCRPAPCRSPCEPLPVFRRQDAADASGLGGTGVEARGLLERVAVRPGEPTGRRVPGVVRGHEGKRRLLRTTVKGFSHVIMHVHL